MISKLVYNVECKASWLPKTKPYSLKNLNNLDMSTKDLKTEQPCTLHGVSNCQECGDNWNKAHKITAKTVRYIQQKLLNRKFTDDEYDNCYQDILLQNANILGCY